MYNIYTNMILLNKHRCITEPFGGVFLHSKYPPRLHQSYMYLILSKAEAELHGGVSAR